MNQLQANGPTDWLTEQMNERMNANGVMNRRNEWDGWRWWKNETVKHTHWIERKKNRFSFRSHLHEAMFP